MRTKRRVRTRCSYGPSCLKSSTGSTHGTTSSESWGCPSRTGLITRRATICLPLAGEPRFQSIPPRTSCRPAGGPGVPKHRMHLQLIRDMVADRLPAKLGRTRSLQDAYTLLLAWPTLGPFLAFQYAIDLNYTTLMSHTESDFVVAGPGALDGLAKCFESLGEFTPTETIVWLTDRQDKEFERYGLPFSGLWGRPLQPIDVQNLLCEVSKYTRVTHPAIKGQSGRTRIKQRFTSGGALPKPFFPPKWGLNQCIDERFGDGDVTSRCSTTVQPVLPLSGSNSAPHSAGRG